RSGGGNLDARVVLPCHWLLRRERRPASDRPVHDDRLARLEVESARRAADDNLGAVAERDDVVGSLALEYDVAQRTGEPIAVARIEAVDASGDFEILVFDGVLDRGAGAPVGRPRHQHARPLPVHARHAAGELDEPSLEAVRMADEAGNEGRGRLRIDLRLGADLLEG